MIYVTVRRRLAQSAGPVADADALAIAQRIVCPAIAKNLSHPAFAQPPKNVVLETLADLKRYGEPIVLQTVQNRSMPLGNQTGMTDDERDKLGRWVNAHK